MTALVKEILKGIGYFAGGAITTVGVTGVVKLSQPEPKSEIPESSLIFEETTTETELETTKEVTTTTTTEVTTTETTTTGTELETTTTVTTTLELRKVAPTSKPATMTYVIPEPETYIHY